MDIIQPDIKGNKLNIEEFAELTNAQLKEECSDMGLKVVSASQKANKSEYLAAIAKHLNCDVDVEEEEEVVVPKTLTKRKVQTPAKLARLDMFRKDRVVVHDVQENQSKDKDEILPISWGNLLLGGQTDFVALSGQPQYIRRGAIKNLMDATTIIHESKPNGGVDSKRVKRFVVTEVAGLSEKELAELASKQRMRNSKYA